MVNPAEILDDPLRFIRADELRDGELRLDFIECRIHEFHKVPTCFFRMRTMQSAEEAGTINLRVGSTAHVERYAGHIGYGVHEPWRGHHFAARAVVLLLPLARRLGLDPLWITTDPENRASRRSLEIAGAQFVEIVDVPFDCGMRKYGGKTRKCRYKL